MTAANLICPHCGNIHDTTCPRIRVIEYHENGTVKRIEFHDTSPPASGGLEPGWSKDYDHCPNY